MNLDRKRLNHALMRCWHNAVKPEVGRSQQASKLVGRSPASSNDGRGGGGSEPASVGLSDLIAAQMLKAAAAAMRQLSPPVRWWAEIQPHASPQSRRRPSTRQGSQQSCCLVGHRPPICWHHGRKIVPDHATPKPWQPLKKWSVGRRVTVGRTLSSHHRLEVPTTGDVWPSQVV